MPFFLDLILEERDYILKFRFVFFIGLGQISMGLEDFFSLGNFFVFEGAQIVVRRPGVINNGEKVLQAKVADKLVIALAEIADDEFARGVQLAQLNRSSCEYTEESAVHTSALRKIDENTPTISRKDRLDKLTKGIAVEVVRLAHHLYRDGVAVGVH